MARSQIIRDLAKAQRALDDIYAAQCDANSAMWRAELRIARLESVLKRIAKTANYQKDWGIIVTCFPKDEFEINEYVQLVLAED